MNKQDYLDIFYAIDVDDNGYLSIKELKLALEDTGACFTDQQFNDLIRTCDINGDGKFNFEEFIKLMNLVDTDNISALFRLLDVDGEGVIYAEKMIAVLN